MDTKDQDARLAQAQALIASVAAVQCRDKTYCPGCAAPEYVDYGAVKRGNSLNKLVRSLKQLRESLGKPAQKRSPVHRN